MSRYQANEERLDSSAREALTFPTPERIRYVKKDVWIEYTRAAEVIAALEELLVHPKAVRMPCLLLVGDSDNGKSTILERFSDKLHPMTMLPNGDPYMPVAHFTMPSVPTPNSFWSALLGSLPAASNLGDSILLKERQATDLAAFIKVQLVLVDQMNNIVQASYKDQRKILAILRDLATVWKTPVVASGTPEMINAMRIDPQLHTRFEVASLPRWEIRTKDFWRFLVSHERLLPLAEPSGIGDPMSPQLAIRIHGMSGGTVGGIVRVMKKAAIQAIKSGRERIDAEILDRVQDMHLSDYS